ncbi:MULTISPECIES: S41 family peptidase [unclassified Bacillus (in: firmicutes)]|uniref:S41 family peptidase n=1 Tax=unclassified Bacillus (in: firmicutes) TaxID=185979 RepID=UPI0008EF703C|nr:MULTISPECIES: S41 family peptidase [unclassified Bacillus (in: firmicutes)]SFB21733.1 carboxyl-terminal processing protease [Bacillus sp. UNCCL13]SFQ91019.1 carboxyl-terminal processing protease [Bacillus sp. cl95]
MNRKWLILLMTGSLVTGAGSTYAGMQWYEVKERSKLEEQLSGNVKVGETGTNESNQLEKVGQAYELILSRYVEKVDQEKLVEGAIQGMLGVLKDPYSVYMDQETATQFNQSLDSSFEGIGAEVSKVDGKIVIVSPFKDSPAEKAGIKPNDEIVKVNGESVEGLDLYEATLKIRGKKGTSVKLGIIRKGLKEPIEIKVKRDEIPLETVHADVKKQNDKKLGYIEITSFSEDTAKDFKKELKNLENQDIEGLLIDVRGNPGGLLSSVEEILKEFVTKDKPYVQIEKRDGEKKRYFSSLSNEKEYPVAVLIDKGSASASEILAGALKEAAGYELVGEKTFGKGTVQQAVPMGDGSNIKLTLFKWLTPEGNWIHKKGIKPSVEVKQPIIFETHPLQVEKALERDMNNEQVKNAQDILKGLGYSPGRNDGYFSDDTERAVKAFQQQNELQATGKIDVKTAAELESAAIAAMKKEKNDLQLQTALRLLAK